MPDVAEFIIVVVCAALVGGAAAYAYAEWRFHRAIRMAYDVCETHGELDVVHYAFMNYTNGR